MDELTSKEKAVLRSAAQGLKPVLRIGKGGVTDQALAELERAFRKDELVKVAFNADRETISRLSEELACASSSICIGGVGKRRSYFRTRDN